MTDQLAWGLIETIQKASKLTQYCCYFLSFQRLWLSNCELSDCGVWAVGQAIAQNRVLVVFLLMCISFIVPQSGRQQNH